MNNTFNESNFKIQVLDNSFVVRSDSERFGINEIVFQGISYAEGLGYITEREGIIPCTYYVIKDLASWRRDLWQEPPEKSHVERFDEFHPPYLEQRMKKMICKTIMGVKKTHRKMC